MFALFNLYRYGYPVVRARVTWPTCFEKHDEMVRVLDVDGKGPGTHILY